MVFSTLNSHLYSISIAKGDLVYFSSDGFIDQFGGANNKKLLSGGYHDLLMWLHGMEMEDQKKGLREFVDSWRGENEQTDDIIVVGLKF